MHASIVLLEGPIKVKEPYLILERSFENEPTPKIDSEHQ